MTKLRETREDLLAKLAEVIKTAPSKERAALGAALEDYVLIRRRRDLAHQAPLMSAIFDLIAELTDVMPMTQAELDQ